MVIALRREFGSVLASLPTETHILEMARQSETRMWEAFRVLDKRRQELTKLLDKLVDRGGVPRKKKVFFADFALQNRVETTIPDR